MSIEGRSYAMATGVKFKHIYVIGTRIKFLAAKKYNEKSEDIHKIPKCNVCFYLYFSTCMLSAL
jgi:hypothetical protein